MRIPIVSFAFSLILLSIPAVKAQGSPDALPKVIRHAQPVYPPLARQNRIQGDVRVKLTTDGESVTSAETIEGPPLLSKAAEDNVRTWKFARHSPSTFVITFRYKLTSGDVDVEFLDAAAVVQIEASPAQATTGYAWIDFGTWKAQWSSNHGKSQGTLELSYSGADGERLSGKLIPEKDQVVEIDFGQRKGDFLAFTAKFRQPDGQQPTSFFVGDLKGDTIVGTFVDDAGNTGKWTATRLR
jgi:Gram-negative bacterial TonB protein C-terminal